MNFYIHFEIATLSLTSQFIPVDSSELKCSHELICYMIDKTLKLKSITSYI